MPCCLTWPVLGSVIPPLLFEAGVGDAVVSSLLLLLSSVCGVCPPFPFPFPLPLVLVGPVGGFFLGGFEGAGFEGGCEEVGGTGSSVVVAGGGGGGGGGGAGVGCFGGSTAGGDGFGAGGVSEVVTGAGEGVLGALGGPGATGMRPPNRSRLSIATARAVVLGRMDTKASDTTATVVRIRNCIMGEYVLDIKERWLERKEKFEMYLSRKLDEDRSFYETDEE